MGLLKAIQPILFVPQVCVYSYDVVAAHRHFQLLSTFAATTTRLHVNAPQGSILVNAVLNLLALTMSWKEFLVPPMRDVTCRPVP